jgi:hypothetical protein
VLWPKIGHMGPLVSPASHATWPDGQVSSLHHPWALDTLSTASARHIGKTFFCKCGKTWLAGHGDVAARPHFGSIEPVLCATLFPHVVLSVTMPYCGHNEDIHGFWSIWCCSII